MAACKNKGLHGDWNGVSRESPRGVIRLNHVGSTQIYYNAVQGVALFVMPSYCFVT